MMATVAGEPEEADHRLDPEVAKEFHKEDIEAGIFFDSNSVLIPEEDSADANHRAKIYNQERRDRLAQEAAERDAAESESREADRSNNASGYADGSGYTNEDPY